MVFGCPGELFGGLGGYRERLGISMDFGILPGTPPGKGNKGVEGKREILQNPEHQFADPWTAD